MVNWITLICVTSELFSVENRKNTEMNAILRNSTAGAETYYSPSFMTRTMTASAYTVNDIDKQSRYKESGTVVKHAVSDGALNNITRAENGKKKKKSLFKTFIFKGFGIAFIKPLSNLKACGVRAIIPFTQNFPEYDRKVVYPRLAIQTSLMIPKEVRLTLVFSVPAHIALYLSSRLLEGTFTTKEVSQRIRKRRATDSVKRVGFSLAIGYRVYGPKRIVLSFGPWMYYLPGSQFIRSLLSLPTIISALFLSFLLYFNLLNKIDVSSPTQQSAAAISTQKIQKETSSVDLTFNINQTQSMMTQNATEAPSLLTNQTVPFWGGIGKYLYSKSPGLGYNFGWTHSNKVDSIGSTLLFEMQPFFPFAREYNYLRNLILSSSPKGNILATPVPILNS